MGRPASSLLHHACTEARIGLCLLTMLLCTRKSVGFPAKAEAASNTLCKGGSEAGQGCSLHLDRPVCMLGMLLHQSTGSLSAPEATPRAARRAAGGGAWRSPAS